jgi:hypothetical protein
LLSVRFSTSVGRSVGRALGAYSAAVRAATGDRAALPAWTGKIPAELWSGSFTNAAQLLDTRDWSEFGRAASLLQMPLPLGGEAAAAPQWWTELERELELRAGLVREQWEIRGPGLLAALQRALGQEVPPKPLEIELVLPLLGGGSHYLGANRAWLEALLHDVSPHFSETLRIGWLVACQAHADRVAARRMLLEAAADVEWLSDDPLTESALEVWLDGASGLYLPAGLATSDSVPKDATAERAAPKEDGER